MARRSATEIFGENIEESLTRCETEDLEYSKEILVEFYCKAFEKSNTDMFSYGNKAHGRFALTPSPPQTRENKIYLRLMRFAYPHQ